MSAYRCSIHALNFPSSQAGGRCPVNGCEERLSWLSNADPHEDWRAQLDGYNRGPEEAAQETPVLVPMVDASIRNYGDRDWIAHDVLIAAGYRNLEDFQVVRIRNRFYELQAFVGRSLTHGIKGGAWWIQEVIPGEEIKKLFRRKGFTVLSAEDYNDLELSRGQRPL